MKETDLEDKRKKIQEIMDSIDKIIETEKQVIMNYHVIKLGLFEKMLITYKEFPLKDKTEEELLPIFQKHEGLIQDYGFKTFTDTSQIKNIHEILAGWKFSRKCKWEKEIKNVN